MYVSILVAYNASPEDFYKNLCPGIENLGHSIYTRSIQTPFISKIGWLFLSHKHTDLCRLTELLESILHHLNPDGPLIALGFLFKNIWDGYKTPPLLAGVPTPATSALPKRQAVRTVHVKVAKEHETDAIVLLHKALQTTLFKHSTNLTMKLVPLFSDCLPSAEQDAIHCTITKQALCLAKFEFVSNPHINLIDKSSVKLHNHSLRTIVLAYHHNWKKTFLSID